MIGWTPLLWACDEGVHYGGGMCWEKLTHGGQEAKSETGRAGLHIFFNSAFEQPKFSPSSPTSKSVIGS